jgi:hypothetical protein
MNLFQNTFKTTLTDGKRPSKLSLFFETLLFFFTFVSVLNRLITVLITQKMSHGVKRFDLILILNQIGKWRFDCDFKSYFWHCI